MENGIPVGLRFSLLHRSFRKKLDETLAEKDLTGVQFGVLGALARLEREGAAEISQRDLEQATRVSHASMTEIVKRLEKKGFLRCEVSERDRRFKSIHSTEKAASLKDEMAQVEDETFRWLCRGLSREQEEELIRLTDVMLANAWADYAKGCDAKE